MSQVAISGNASGTGTLTIAAPNTNSNYTLTLPTNTGTLITTASTGQVIPKAALPTGSVLQVVSGTFSSNQSTSSTSFTSTTIALSITPTSATSKILARLNGGMADTNASGQQMQLTIYRNSTNLGDTNRGLTQFYSSSGRAQFPVAAEILDSPATTSSTTYTVYIKSGGAYSVGVEIDPAVLSMTLMEIAA
jgi:hypothetical protein